MNADENADSSQLTYVYDAIMMLDNKKAWYGAYNCKNPTYSQLKVFSSACHVLLGSKHGTGMCIFML